MCSPVLEEPALLVSPTVVGDVVYTEGEYEISDVVSDAIPPPPGFPPFSWPTGEECVVIERFGSSLDVVLCRTSWSAVRMWSSRPP